MSRDSSCGAYVRQRRREMDLTQGELARRVTCAAVSLHKIEADDLQDSDIQHGQFNLEGFDLFSRGTETEPFI